MDDDQSENVTTGALAIPGSVLAPLDLWITLHILMITTGPFRAKINRMAECHRAYVSCSGRRLLRVIVGPYRVSTR